MFTRTYLSIVLLFVSLLLSSNTINAVTKSTVPEQLAGWQDWVKYQQEYRNCPNLNGQNDSKSNYICAWPGQLKLEVSDQKALFSQTWQILEKSRVPLVGNNNYWPQAVTVNNQSIPVMNGKTGPYILLDRGEYRIKGQLNWKKRPESIQIPQTIALIDLSLNGKKNDFNKLVNGNLWLGSVKKNQTQEADFIKLWVNRLITDGHPMQMQVALKMEVSGRAREQKLNNFSNQHYQLMSIDSPLNSRVDSQGDFWVQLKPGSHRIILTFKIHSYPQEIRIDAPVDNWPKQEIWVYKSDERLRSTQITGLSAIDSEQGFMPTWSSLPHFIMTQNETMTINERHRGISHSADSLSLNRQMWLSFDNRVYYFFDQIKGSKSTDWRISTLDNYRLTQLSNQGKERLITYDNKKRTGAEIRTAQINISAGGEVDAKNMQHASGWDIPFSKTNVTLNIPPGRKVIHIGGTDSSRGDWLGKWTLIDFFFLLVTVALVFKCFGMTPSIFATATLVLGYHEVDMPGLLWINFVIALSLAIKITTDNQVLSKILQGYKWFSFAILIIALLPFIADQIRFTLYPQLEKPYQRLSSPNSYETANIKRKDLSQEADEGANKIVILGERVTRRNRSSVLPADISYEQDAIIQAGKGKPGWQWQKIRYSWNGPIAGDEKINIVLLSEVWVKLWRIMLILFSMLWLISIVNTGLLSQLKGLIQGVTKAKSLTSILFSMILLNGFNSDPLMASESQISESSVSKLGSSTYPSDQLLNELQKRIYQPPLCSPDCISVANAQLNISETQLELTMSYHSGAKIAGLLPTSSDWRIDKIYLNKKPIKGLWKNNKGSWVTLPKGISTVKVEATLKDKVQLSLKFPVKPQQFQLSVSGWETSGVSNNKLIQNTIQLNRKISKTTIIKNKTGKPIQAQEQSIKNLVNVTRHFNLGTRWKLLTSINRKAPSVGSIAIDIPLYSFEKPLEKTSQIKSGKMQVVMPSNIGWSQWQSSIDAAETFELNAIENHAVNEIWEISVSPSWNIQIKGIPAVRPLDLDKNDYWIYQYYPRPGEKLQFKLTKPPAVKGESVAITKIEQNYQISKRKTTNKINLSYRATRSEDFLFHIGETQLKSLSHNGQKINPGKIDGIVSVSLLPGKNKLSLELEMVGNISNNLKLNSTNINRDFSNLTTQVKLPNSRWLIYASGNGYGPAILYWGELIFFILLAAGLCRLSFSPLNYFQWLILGLGMSTFSWPAMLIVSCWLFILKWREQNKDLNIKQSLAFSWTFAVISVIAIFAFVMAVPFGLLQTPDMGVTGNGSSAGNLLWYLDRGENQLGEISIISLPIWIYKGLMLIWATWLSFSLVHWIGRCWKDLSKSSFVQNKPVHKKESAQKPIEK